MIKIETYKDLDITIKFEFTATWTDFWCYEIIGYSSNDNECFSVPNYERKGSTGSGDDTQKIEEAQSLISGVVKWDGCSHYTFGDEGYIHLCGKRNVKNISEIIKFIYNRCGELMESKDKTEFPI